ncbi:serine/arginine repetitive matrix protein 2 isoform X2 [Phymastichus coffea]|uniref:serine/arginine repetitive matrix protein 2 isoform X2 n=1 Tax=Phymastichus coffea TaxID=108790 RepID=UPI00273C0637|nr:serine/arginine repetitive matrix protein 2 isoform X2 [Phymastichus coffea]
MVVGEASIHNIMGGMESTGGVRLHNHRRKLKQRFDIIKKLGQGTYGKVQLGINKETGQEVAIKTIKKCKIETEADLIRIRREIQIMSSVQHPNIIHIYEVFENREKMVLVMEYAAGGELYDYLSERKVLTEEEARRIFRQIATAVFYCHKHKICHRDLKLENILLDQNRNAKIADFGLSNVFDERRLLSTFCGSPLYASPEIVKGTPYHGPEVDCWSLGVLLYTLVYGAMPFDGSNFKRLVKQISSSDYFEPKKKSPASPLIKEILTVCPRRRADIEKICTHWWVNEGYEQNCLDIAEDLAAETPVRLDLLLSLVPPSASAEKLVVGDQSSQPAPSDITNSLSSETLVPTRSQSVGSLMELEQNDRRIREMIEEEAVAVAAALIPPPSGSEAKRKLETTPSMDETNAAGAKKKERTRRKEGTDDRDPRAYRSASKHHSAPLPNSILEEAMEVDPAVIVSVPTSKTVDIKKVEDSASCLEVKEEEEQEALRKKVPCKEQSKTVISQPHQSMTTEDTVIANNKNESVAEKSNEVVSSPFIEKINEIEGKPEAQALIVEETKSDVPKQKSSAKQIPEPKVEDITQVQPKETKKLRNKALSLDSEIISAEAIPKVSTERRRSKIFETAEKFNQLLSPTTTEPEKPKKIFIPGVNVGGAKAAFERKASLSSATSVPQIIKSPPVSKVIIDVPSFEKKPENEKKDTSEPDKERDKKREEEKKRAVDIITGALGKPPMQRRMSGSPPVSPQSIDPKKQLGLKIPLGPNDLRNATVTVTTPTETKFEFEATKPELQAKAVSVSSEVTNHDAFNPIIDEPKKCSKLEITLKSATLPRPRKTSKAEITLSNVRPVDGGFRSEVEAKIDAFEPQKLRTQRSEVAFPVAAVVPQTHRSSSLEPESSRNNSFKERIIPIQVEPIPQTATVHSTTPPPKPPLAQRSLSQRSSSLSRQSTNDSDTDSALGSAMGPEPIRKSPREYIIPIAVEGGGYVTPRSGSVEPENKNSTPTSINPPRSRFVRPRRMGSLLSDASEDESPFSSLHRDNDDLLQRHMHRLRSSRPSRQPPEHADSLSSGEDDDDDGFELLTAENLFSTLLSRVRSLTQRLNVDDNRGAGFPNSRLLGRMGSNSPQSFWNMHEPLSRRISDSQFRRSMSRENNDRFSRKDSSGSMSSQQNSSGARTPSRDSLFEMGNNTLPRVKSHQRSSEPTSMPSTTSLSPSSIPPLNDPKSPESLDQTLARRLSRQFIEQTRQTLPRSPSLPRERAFRVNDDALERYRSRSHDRAYVGMRRANSLLETGSGHERRSPRRSISLFDDEDKYLPPLPRRKLTTTVAPIVVEKIQEEQPDEVIQPVQHQIPRIVKNDDFDDTSLSEAPSFSVSNCFETTSSRSAISGETSPTESTSNVLDYSSSYKSASTKDLHNRLLAVENLIKESKMKNLGLSKYNPNLSSNYKDLDKCDKESLSAISDTASAAIAKRRSCIPSLRFRSGSLTRDSSLSRERSSKPEDTLSMHALTPERSLLSKFFRSSSSRDVEIKDKDKDKDKSEKPKPRRISRFLRPDFFDTPREESQYVKEKEAQKAAENERRKSRFMRRKAQLAGKPSEDKSIEDEQLEKQLKNEVNLLTKGKAETSSKEPDETSHEKPSIKSSFLQTLERKLEKFRSGDDSAFKANSAKPPIALDNKAQTKHNVESNVQVVKDRENSVQPAENSRSPVEPTESTKKTTSVEDLSTSSSASAPLPKSKVNSVLGLFKNNEQSGTPRSQGQTILSRLRKNAYKGSRSDTVLSPDANGTATSKIPTKFASKKIAEAKKSPEKSTLGFKRSPSKDKETTPPKRVSPETKKPTMERLSKSLKKSPEKLLKGKTEKSPEKSFVKKNSSPEKAKSPERIIDNKQSEETNGDNGSKLKKKIVTSTTTSSENSSKSDKVETGKKVKKVVKTKEAIGKDKEKDGSDNTKKKKIVRVVRKVVKKSSDTSDSKSDDKEKLAKTVVKKTVVAKKDKTPETIISANNLQKNGPDRQAAVQNEMVPESKVEKDFVESHTNKSTDKCKDMEAENSEPKTSKLLNNIAPAKIVIDQKPNREKLKLELSRIPQHTFRNITPPRRESPKSETPKSEIGGEIPKLVWRSQSDDTSSKLSDNLSKMTHRATIARNKIVIDKPLRQRDIADLKIESHTSDSEMKLYEENHVEIPKSSPSEIPKETEPAESLKEDKNNVEDMKDAPSSKDLASTDDLLSPTEDTESFDSWSICSADINHTRNDLHSPTSPSYSSLYRRDSAEPSPTNESVLERIRRKSFYCRFNDRKRKTSLNASPAGVNISSSLTLPRKFSFQNPRESGTKQEQSSNKSKSNNFTLAERRNSEKKSYSLYNDELPPISHRKSPIELTPMSHRKSPIELPPIIHRKSPIDLPAMSHHKSPIERDRYSDGGSTVSSYSNEHKSPSQSYSQISSPSYDPLRKYLSPTFDSSPARRKYHSTEFSTNSDLVPYKNSSLSDARLEPRTISSTLPRRFGSSMSGPKTVEYFEELLAPNNTDYLGGRRFSPLPHEHYTTGKYENGYYNGSIDLSQFSAEKWKSQATRPDLIDGLQAESRVRKVSQCISEPDDLSTSLDLRATTSTAQ